MGGYLSKKPVAAPLRASRVPPTSVKADVRADVQRLAACVRANDPRGVEQALADGARAAIVSDAPNMVDVRTIVYDACTAAAQAADGDCLALLLANGARPSLAALYAAAEHDCPECLELLLDFGMQPSQRGAGHSQSATEVARGRGHARCVEVLERRTAFLERDDGVALSVAAGLSAVCIERSVLPEGVVDVVADCCCYLRQRGELLVAAHQQRREEAADAAASAR